MGLFCTKFCTKKAQSVQHPNFGAKLLSFAQEQQSEDEPNAFLSLDGTLHQPELVGGEDDDIIFALAEPPDQRAAVRPNSTD